MHADCAINWHHCSTLAYQQMILTDYLPIAAAALFAALAAAAIKVSERRPKSLWLLPAGFSTAFLLFSLLAVGIEGPVGFWAEHTRNLWGNQIWFDLLLAIGIGWFLIVPQASRLGMRLPLWLLLIVATGCIGFTAMLSRFLYLQAQVDTVPSTAP